MMLDRTCTAGNRLLALVVILTVFAAHSMAESRFIALSIRGGVLPRTSASSVFDRAMRSRCSGRRTRR
jgi:hypothetical protein